MEGTCGAARGYEWEVSDRWDWCSNEPELIFDARVFTEEAEGHIPETRIHFLVGKKKNETLKGFMIQSGQVAS